MMLGRVLPVNLPATESEIRLVQSRQNKLARDINRINTQIRNNQISASQGKRRILFKKAEIDQLEHYKRSRRTPTGRLSPPPRTAAPVRSKNGPSNKYNPAASDKVPGATGPADFSVPQPQYKRSNPDTRNQQMIEEDRAGMTSKSNQRPSGSRPPQQTRDKSVNPRGLREADYYNRLVSNFRARVGRSPPSSLLMTYRKRASTMWRANMSLPAKATPRPPSPSQQAKDAASGAKKAGSGLIDKVKAAVSKSSSRSTSRSTSRPAPKKTLKDNPHGKTYGTSYSRWEKARSGGKAKKYNGVYYGPSDPTKSYAWSKWNSANLSGYGGMPQAALIRRKAEMNRQTTLMRMRAGAKLDLNQPIMQKRTNEVDPLQKKVKVSEMSGLAGGLTKTRNSMQRLL